MKLGFIGAGNMAGAILLGGAHGANVYDVNAETMRRREQECGAVPFSSAEALIRASDVILLAVKPNVAPGVLRENRAAFAGKAVISIVAGLTVATLKALLPAEARFLRVMPNTPAMAGAGMTALCMEHTLTDAERPLRNRSLTPLAAPCGCTNIRWTARWAYPAAGRPMRFCSSRPWPMAAWPWAFPGRTPT